MGGCVGFDFTNFEMTITNFRRDHLLKKKKQTHDVRLNL